VRFDHANTGTYTNENDAQFNSSEDFCDSGNDKAIDF
jgi:hypothetical protein